MLTVVYSISHFVVDLACAFAIFTGCSGSPNSFLLYNFFAFAMQMPLGLLADKLNKNRYVAAFGTILVALMCLTPRLSLLGACLCGLGNGLFHVGGGLDVLNVSERKATQLGIFVSPGALGIYLGALLNRSYLPFILGLLFFCVIAMVVLVKANQRPNAAVSMPTVNTLPVLAAVFLVVVLRSVGGMAAHMPWKTGIWSTVAVCATASGKAVGGLLSDRFGGFRTAIVSLCLAALLFIPNHTPFAGVCAIFFFNMTMPITLSAAASHMHGAKGFSFGLLTFALFLGYLPIYLGFGGLDGRAMAILTLVSALLLLPVLRKGATN